MNTPDEPLVQLIIQARTDSSRLPGKALIPISGVSLVSLAALRAGNTGLPLMVATTSRSVDDRLVESLRLQNINVFRGDKDNVLKRFVDATRSLAERDILVRLTGDNVFPDGELIENVINSFINSSAVLMATRIGAKGLPYGVSVEVFRIKAIRDLLREPELTNEMKEHVTLAFYERGLAQLFLPEKYQLDEYAALRATIDTEQDLEHINSVFYGIDDPINISCDKLIQRLLEKAQND